MRKPTALLLLMALPLALAGLTAAGPALAQDDDDGDDDTELFRRNGAYLTAQGLRGFELFDSGSLNADDFWGAGGRLGYRFHPRFAAEVHGEWMRPGELRTGGTKVADIEGAFFTLNGKAFALTGRYQPYGYVGVGGGFISIEDTTSLSLSEEQAGFVARFGAGVDVYFNHAIGANLDTSYVLPTGDIDDFPYVSLAFGFFLRF